MILKLHWQLVLFIVFTNTVSSRNPDDDEGRPYEFGFTIDGQQHRHESKDVNGIIMGEFGFITADGIYHVTVYATDENGSFKILSMKNIRISGPLDEPGYKFPSKTPTADQISEQTTTTRTTTAAPVTYPAKYMFTTLPSLNVPACSSCKLPSTVKPPGTKLDFQTPEFQNKGKKPYSPSSPGLPNPPSEPLIAPPGASNLPAGFPIPPPGAPKPPIGFPVPPPSAPNPPVGFPLPPPGIPKPAPEFPIPSPGIPKPYPKIPNPSLPSPSNPNLPSFPIPPPGIPNTPPGFPPPPPPKEPILHPISPLNPNPPRIPPYQPQKPEIKVNGDKIVIPGREPIKMQYPYPNMNEGLPNGITENDMLDLLYKFNYTLGFHGHHEKGLKNGAKIGAYFVNGRDGISRVVEYVADENGYRPKVKFINLGLDSPDTPKEGTEKTFGLKGFEFVWYPI